MKHLFCKAMALFSLVVLLDGQVVKAGDANKPEASGGNMDGKSVSSNIVAQTGDIEAIYSPEGSNKLWTYGEYGYPRLIEIQHNGSANGTLLATFELSSQNPGYPLYKSSDRGKTWNYITTVRETLDPSIQSEWQPFIFELPRSIGDMPAGTILLAACSINPNHGKKSAIRIYRSYDTGNSWEEYSTVITGGGLQTGVWEPFILMLDDGRLVCYYSDSTDDTHHSQMLSYCTSADGVNWGTPVHFVALADRTLRPGMATVCRMNNGKYFMTYEMCDKDNPDCGNKVTYRFSDNALDWGDPTGPGTTLQTSQGYIPGSGPYTAYVPSVGENGLIVVRACFQTPSAPEKVGTYLYVNDNYGQGKWETMDQPLPYKNMGGYSGYSSASFLSSDGVTLYLANAGINSKNSYEINFTTLVFGEKADPQATANGTSKPSNTISGLVIIILGGGLLLVLTVIGVFVYHKSRH